MVNHLQLKVNHKSKPRPASQLVLNPSHILDFRLPKLNAPRPTKLLLSARPTFWWTTIFRWQRALINELGKSVWHLARTFYTYDGRWRIQYIYIERELMGRLFLCQICRRDSLTHTYLEKYTLRKKDGLLAIHQLTDFCSRVTQSWFFFMPGGTNLRKSKTILVR